MLRGGYKGRVNSKAKEKSGKGITLKYSLCCMMFKTMTGKPTVEAGVDEVPIKG